MSAGKYLTMKRRGVIKYQRADPETEKTRGTGIFGGHRVKRTDRGSGDHEKLEMFIDKKVIVARF